MSVFPRLDPLPYSIGNTVRILEYTKVVTEIRIIGFTEDFLE